MMAADISWTEVWAWASGSSLLSTIVTLVIGSWLLYKWQCRRSFEYEVVKFISNEISSYANDAVEYWSSFSERTQNRNIVRQKIKNGLPILFELIDNSMVLDESGKKNIHEALGNMFDAATGGNFEASEDVQRNEADERIESILFAAAISRRVLFMAAIKK